MRWPGNGDDRPDHRAARRRQEGQAGLSARHLAVRRGNRRTSSASRDARRSSRHATPMCSTATAIGAGSRLPKGETYAGTWVRPMCSNPPYFDGMTMEPEPGHRHRRGARILAAVRRQDHDRPHFARRARSRRPRRPANSCWSARSRQADFNQIRHAARQSRSHDARHLRQYPHQELHAEDADGTCRRAA